MAKRDPRLRAFVKVDKYGQVVPSTLILRRKPPENGTSHYWIEIEENICCSYPLSSWTYTDGSAINDGVFLLTVGGKIIANATNTESGEFTTSAGQVVTVTTTGSGPVKTLLVVNDSSGVVLSNQTGTTGQLTYTYTSTGDVYTVIATQNNTTTTTTSTTTTSTTSTSTTSTTSTSTSTTTTTITTPAPGLLRVENNTASGIAISNVTSGALLTGGTFPVANGAGTNMTIAGNGTNVDIAVTITATGIIGPYHLYLYNNGTIVETEGPIVGAGTHTFGPVSFTTSQALDIILEA